MRISGHIENEITSYTYNTIEEVLYAIAFENNKQFEIFENVLLSYLQECIMLELFEFYKSKEFIITITLTEQSLKFNLTYGNLPNTENLINQLNSIVYNKIKLIVSNIYDVREIIYKEIINSEKNTFEEYYQILIDAMS